MKYTYAYKTSDGVRHEASMDAASREAVFAALRAKGIKAIKVVAADGSKANGEIRGVRKRIVFLIAVMVAVGTALLVILAGRRYGREVSPDNPKPQADRSVYTGDIQEVNDYLKERDKLENEFRIRIEERVKKGTLTRREADEILQTVFR